MFASVLQAPSSLSIIAKPVAIVSKSCAAYAPLQAVVSRLKKQPRPSRRKTAARTARSLALLATVSAMAPLLAPQSSPLQKAASSKPRPPVPNVCVVTGGTGFVGQRLVEMLVERGAKKVISLDIVPPPKDAWQHPAIDWRVCDVTDKEGVSAAIKGADCVWHNAAAVGPFHPRDLYFKVNYEGTLNVIRACRDAGVRKIVMSSSPSTRFDGSDVD